MNSPLDVNYLHLLKRIKFQFWTILKIAFFGIWYLYGGFRLQSSNPLSKTLNIYVLVRTSIDWKIIIFLFRTSIGGVHNNVGTVTEVQQLRSNSVSENNNWKTIETEKQLKLKNNWNWKTIETEKQLKLKK